MDELPRLQALIADADSMARAHLRRLLSALHVPCDVEEVTCGCAALDAFRRRKVELALIEVDLPDINGFDVVRAAGLGATPLFAFTTTNERHAFDAFAVGAIGYLVKPVDAERLGRLVTRAVHWYG